MVEPILTRVAHTGADELRLRGWRVFASLLGNATVAQLVVLGIDGKLLAPDDARLVDDVVAAMSSADPRLWPFKITRLAAAHGVVSYAVAASLVAAEGGMYGSNRLLDTARWLRALSELAAPSDADIRHALDGNRSGFGVLYRARDERFDALVRQLHARGVAERKHAALCTRIVRVAREQLGQEPHAYLAIAAIALDLGLSDRAVGMLGLLPFFHDSLANASEGAEQAPASLRELPDACVDYRGPVPRVSPRACH